MRYHLCFVTFFSGIKRTYDNKVSVLKGNGFGSFGSATNLLVDISSHSVVISADFNGDGKADLAVATSYNSSISILLNTLPFVTANASASTICAGTSVTLTGGGATSYTWSGGVIDGVAFSAPSSTTTYTVDGTTSGCTNTATKTITVNPLPVSNAGNDLTICSGTAGSIGATAVAGNTYSWSPGTGISDSTVSNTVNTTVNATANPIVTSYTVTTTTTATGCQSKDSSVITVNPQPVLAITNPVALCFPSTIDITTNAVTAGSTGGGTLSYWTDAGATNPLSSPNALVASGTNYIKVTATGGCTDIKPVSLIVHPQPTATFTTQDESSSLYCDGTIKAHLTGGTGTIQPQWLDSAQTVLATIDSIGGLCQGTYTLHLTDSNSCANTYTQAVQAGPIPPTPPLCLVTVDSTLTHNLLVWEKTNINMTPIDSFIVYREFGTNVYQRIGAVVHDSLSTFHDFAANPAITGYRYKLKSKNAHGVKSLFSDYHNTIYLTNNGANFSWTQYQIENNTTPVSTYNVYRDDNSTGNFHLIGNTSGNQFGFTDIQYSSFPNSSYYVEAVMAGGVCNPSRAGYAASRSNVKYIGSAGVQQLSNSSAISIYPNPATNKITIGIIGKTTLRLYDVVGKLVYTSALTMGAEVIDISFLSNGEYFIHFISDKETAVKKITVSK